MAVIKPGPMISDIRGSINGVTFARNRAGLFARQRVAPVQPNTARQTAVRNAVAVLQVQWRTILTAAQRAGWESLGTISGSTGALGDRIRLTGIQAYLRTNVIRHIASTPYTQDAPPIPYETHMRKLVFDSRVTAGVTLESIALELGGGDILQLQISPVFSPTRNFYKGPYPGIFWVFMTTGLPLTLSTGQPFDVGERHFIAARMVEGNGRVSVTNLFQTNVLADP